LISALITLSPPGGWVLTARSAEFRITENEKATYHRIRLKLQTLPKLGAL